MLRYTQRSLMALYLLLIATLFFSAEPGMYAAAAKAVGVVAGGALVGFLAGRESKG